MNGSAINQVLLNLPQSGNGSTKNTGSKDTDTADFAQAFQTQQANARADRNQAARNQAAERNQAIERSRATERQRDIANNTATERNNDRHNTSDKQSLDKDQPRQSEGSENTVPHSKTTSKPAAAAKRKDTESPDASDQQATSADASQQATVDTAEQTVQSVTGQDKTCEQEVCLTEQLDVSGEVTDTASTLDTAEADASTTTLTLQQLLAGKASNSTDKAADTTQTTDAKSALIADQTEATATIEISADGAKKAVATDSTDDLEEGNASAKSLVDQLGLAQADTPAGTIPPTAQNTPNSDAESPVDISAGATNSTTITPELTTTGEATTDTATELTDELVAQVTTGLKDDAQSKVSNKTVTAEDTTQAATEDNAGTFDKSNFEKMFKTMAQSALGEAAPRDQQPASSTQNPPASSGFEYAASRPQEAQGVTGLRNFVVQTSVPTQVGQPQWSQAVGEKVLWLAAQNISSAEINLHPQDLGPVQVKVSVNQDQANVSFTSHHPVVREVLDQNLNRLRDMFSEQGLNLVNVDVSDRSFQRQQGEGKEQQGQGNNAKSETEEETVAAVSVIKAQRLVDHYA